MAVSENPNELRLVRVYDAPVQTVWDAWTDPAQAAQWWGPRGFTITTHSKDFREGGIWHYTMHGPDGTDYPNKTVYLEIEEHRKMVYDHGGYDDRPPLFRVTVLFDEQDGKTTMDFTMTLPTAEDAAQAAKFIKQAGGNATWDRLAEYLDKQSTGAERFVLNRSFAAPAETLFDMWIEPDQLVNWLPPQGFDMQVLESDVRPGGSMFYKMSNAAGVTLYGRSEYVELERPRRIIYRQQFCDENQELSRHPLAEVWPATLLNTVTFTPEGAGHTRITMCTEVVGDATAEELVAFADARSGMSEGWTGSLDALEALVAEA